MNKKLLYATVGILGTLVIFFGVLFGFYYNKVRNFPNFNSANHKIEIVGMKAENKVDKTFFDVTFTSSASEKTLDQLMLNYAHDFDLGPMTQYGRMVNGIFDQSTNSIYHPDSSHYFEITSQTYIDHFPSAAAGNNDPQANQPYSLNIGVSSVYLLFDEKFIFVESSF